MERKSAIISDHGGKCEHCGYSYSLSALSFYDKDGDSLHVDANVLANSSLTNLRKKLKNAQVLCRNCYEELQNPSLVSSRPSKTSGEIPQELRDSSASVGMTAQKFAENLTRCGVKHGQTVVLGVSGGVDSVTMLDLFAQSPLKLNIIVAHMNHGVREDAYLDEQLVKELAKKHGFKYVSKTIQIPKTGNLEEGLRDARRDFLLKVANDNGDCFVALAHNANDQAETLILNLVRGSGPAGLGAMSMSDEQILRPLLNFSRIVIENYALAQGLVWREDITNRDTNYNRNYIRHRILPMLETLNPEYLSAINRTTWLQRKIDEHFKEEAYRLTHETSAEKLRRLDKPLLYETLGLLYERVKGDRKDLSLSHLSAIAKMIENSKGSKTLDLPGGVTVSRTYDRLDFCAKKEHNTPSAPSTKKLKLGAQKFGNWTITVAPMSFRPNEVSGEIPQGSLRDPSATLGMTTNLTRNDSTLVDAEKLANLVVRTRKPGDKIAKKGLGGNKKLQDLFVDAKIDRAKRDTYPLVVDSKSGEVLWVPGLAKSDYKPINDTDIYQITVEEADHETKKD